MLTKVKQTISEHQLIEKDDHLLVALSGGPDSVALLHLLSRLKRSMKLSLSAVYINHGIQPKAAAKEEKFCKRLCDALKIELSIVRENVPSLAKRVKKSSSGPNPTLGRTIEAAGKASWTACSPAALDQA